MQHEMEAVQPKLLEASKEVDAAMSSMEKEQVIHQRTPFFVSSLKE